MQSTSNPSDQADPRTPPGYTLFNPGPVNVPDRVRQALNYPDACHRESEIATIMRDVRRKVTLVSGGDDAFSSVLLTGSGTAALEAALSSVVPPTGKLLVLDNGNYGERMFRIAEINGVPLVRMEFGWRQPIDPAAVQQALRADTGITHVAMVHHETSTGMLNPLRAVGSITRAEGRSLIVDAISSLGAEEFDLTADGVDWCVGTANKCLEGLPGVSFVTASRALFEALDAVPPRSYYLDLHGHYISQEYRDAPLFTPAVQILAAFEAALDLVLEEGAKNRAKRYADLSEDIRRGAVDLGLELDLPARFRSNSVTNIKLPDGVEYAYLHDRLKDAGYVVYGVQEQLGRVFRVASMGQLTSADVKGLLTTLEQVLAPIATGP